MRKPSFAAVSGLLLLQMMAWSAVAASPTPPSSPLWRFDTHG
jgi:hypothetical protein